MDKISKRLVRKGGWMIEITKMNHDGLEVSCALAVKEENKKPFAEQLIDELNEED